MFNSMLRDFEDDPFFSDPFHAHREHVHRMMRSFSEPFGASLMPSVTDGGNRGRHVADPFTSSSLALRNDHRDLMRNPFGMFDNMMTNIRNTMEGMHRNFDNQSTDSNTHSFSSSSVMTYSKVGDEPPKVFQATSSTRQAPGGIKETRRALKDSDSGLEQMSIGHYIQDRAHVVEKKYNKKTGQKEFNQDFQNLDESEAQCFDEEWQQELSKFKPSRPRQSLREPQPRTAIRAALPAPDHGKRDQQRQTSGSRDKAQGSVKTNP
ncbi:Myeloid leukemia factor 1 [Oryzias melastigma]|uniref:Myeloid leukemia factor 1 n=1 Tax=Oryzias melastigma TaxID=30732 RepID=A0A834FMJ4_ORYME|nr:Myeloid leukemia factor 1 [Oryzias melastigma]